MLNANEKGNVKRNCRYDCILPVTSHRDYGHYYLALFATRDSTSCPWNNSKSPNVFWHSAASVARRSLISWAGVHCPCGPPSLPSLVLHQNLAPAFFTNEGQERPFYNTLFSPFANRCGNSSRRDTCSVRIKYRTVRPEPSTKRFSNSLD